MLYSEIPNGGYSRHFKYVKNLLYVIPSIKIQIQIVEVLDEAQRLLDNRKNQIKLLDDLIDSIFYDMFGDPIKKDRDWDLYLWEEIFNTITGKPNSNAIVEDGQFPFFTCSKEAITRVLEAYEQGHRKALLVMATGARVIIVIGCINALVSRVLGTLI